MNRKRRCQPRVEKLESLTLLSGHSEGLHHAASVVKIDGAPPVSTTPTIISLTGSYHIKPDLPDVGANYNFWGHGRVMPVGGADVSGNVRQLGFVASSHAEGLIVIAMPKGSVTPKLEGPKQPGFAKLPDSFSFKITNSSGSYLNDRGHGTLVLVLDPVKAGADHGTFTMVFTQ